MNWAAIDNCVAYLCITLVAVLAAKIGVGETLAGAAIAAIAGLAGRRLATGEQSPGKVSTTEPPQGGKG